MRENNSQNNYENLPVSTNTSLNISELSPTNIEQNKSWKYMLIYIIFFIGVLIFSIINYFETTNAFDDNRTIQLNPEFLCKPLNQILNLCLDQYKNNTPPGEIVLDCNQQSSEVQKCYDRVDHFNKKCFLYLSEYEECLRDEKKKSNDANNAKNQCHSLHNELNLCNPYGNTIDI